MRWPWSGPSGEEGPLVLYEFRAPILNALSHTQPLVAKASRREAERFIALNEFGDLFGGYVLWWSPEPPTREMPDDGLGVWGVRTVARFRRVLRERGAEVVFVEGPGPPQRLKAVTQDFRRRNWRWQQKHDPSGEKAEPDSGSG